MRESYKEKIRLRKMRERKWVQAVAGAIAGILVLALLYCGYVIYSDDLWFGKLQDSDKQATEESSLKDQVNILVMGVDKREDDVGRSDTLFLVSIDPKRQQIFQLSIPRDTRLLIPGYGWDKVNHAYSLGGKDLTVETVEGFLGVKIQHTVEIDFQGFYRIVDAIGGVEIDVEKRMYYEDPWDQDGGLVIDLRPGLQRMNGRTAITYVRYRDEDGDIGRIERQQKFMKAVIDQVSRPAIITRLPAIISEVSSAVETDLSTLELLNLGRFFKESREKNMQTNMGMVPGGGYYIGGISYWVPNMNELLGQIDEFDGMEPTPQWKRWAQRQINLYWDYLPVFDEEGYAGSAPDEIEDEDEEEEASDPRRRRAGSGGSSRAESGGEEANGSAEEESDLSQEAPVEDSSVGEFDVIEESEVLYRPE